MNRTAIKYTLIAFVVTVVWTLLEHVLGYNTTKHEIGQYTRMITTFMYWAFVIIAIIEVKKNQAGEISFRQALNTGVVVSVGYSLLVTAWFALYAEVINKEYQSSLLAYEKSKLVAANASPEKINMKLKEVELQSGGSVASYLMLFGFMALFGLGISIITATIVRRRAMKQG